MPLIKNPLDAANVFTIKTSHYLIAGMSLVTALSWNEAMKRNIENIYPMPRDSGKVIIAYSIIMTILLILIIYMLPDTKAELPLDVQHKIHQAEIDDNRHQMHQLQLQIQRMRSEMEK